MASATVVEHPAVPRTATVVAIDLAAAVGHQRFVRAGCGIGRGRPASGAPFWFGTHPDAGFSAVVRRVVRRAYGAAKDARRSVKIRRAQPE